MPRFVSKYLKGKISSVTPVLNTREITMDVKKQQWCKLVGSPVPGPEMFKLLLVLS